MKKGVFIIPYFGKFNEYFPLFLKSCAYNKDFDWLIFTDDKRNFDYPSNVTVVYMNFEDVQYIFRKKFSFKISLERPYKLCDFKVAYGYVFSEYLTQYRMWGYCDTDLLFGRLSNFITEDDVDEFDKIGIYGHCTLYRNEKEINELFMKPLNGKLRYKEVFSNNKNQSFDEEFNDSINTIFEAYHKKIRYTEYQANIYTKSSNFKLTNLNDDCYSYNTEKLKKAFFVWDNGVLLRWIMNNNELSSQEYMYIHMQSRPMHMNGNLLKSIRFKIIPNSFDALEVEVITKDNFSRICRKHFNLHYFKLRTRNLYIKIKKLIGI